MELSIKNFGPIGEASLSLGDLTFLIGPQASGKSLTLELLKLIIDREHIVSTLGSYNYVLNRASARNILDWYFGEGLSSLFTERTMVSCDGKAFSPNDLLQHIESQESTPAPKESVFYVPAQRILSISDGRPKNFTEFDVDTPYVLRRFSETLRVFLQGGLGNPDTLFPMKNRLQQDVTGAIDGTIFHGGKVVMDESGSQRKIKLDVDGVRIPFMAWSAGQKEFMPLLLATYCLSGPMSPVVNRTDYQWVIVEEPEMGLHPRAILSVLLEILELMNNGYKMVVSTHSTTFLEFVWTFNNLLSLPAERFKTAMCELFDVHENSQVATLFAAVKEARIKTYFSGEKDATQQVNYVDISNLNAFDEDKSVSEWGGLTSFAGRASEIVSKYGEI